MPSTLVHIGFSGLLAAALLGDFFDRRAVAAVLLVTVVPDLDAFVGLVSTAGHRTVGHTFVIPGTAALLWVVDTRLRDASLVRERWGQRGVVVGWMCITVYAVSAIALDMVTGAVNALWPIHDQLYKVNGEILLSNQRGFVQTFVDLNPEPKQSAVKSFGNSSEVHVSTGVDPKQGSEPKTVERVFPIAQSGWRLLLLVVGLGVTTARLWQVERGE